MNLEYDEDPVSQSDSFDDLEEFQEHRQNQIVQQIMQMKSANGEAAPGNQIEDDAELIKGGKDKLKHQHQKYKKIEKEVTQEQRKAREMKILNARKYFQMAKLMYIQQISSSLQQTTTIIRNRASIVAKWLSLLTSNLLSEFIKFKKAKPLSINVIQFLDFLRRGNLYIARYHRQEKKKLPESSAIFWSICQQLKLGCRKVNFFSVDSIVEETFFQLRYQTSEAIRKRQNKKMKEHQIMKIKLSQQIEENLQNEEDSSKYMIFEDFQFDEASFKSKSRDIRSSVQESNDSKEARRENNFTRKKNFKNSYFQLFDPLNNGWLLINSEIFQVQKPDMMKKMVLEGKFILSFYSTRIIHFKPEYKILFSLRTFQNVVIQDLTMFFEDNHRQLATRRKRIGLKSIMRHIFDEASFDKNRFLLNPYDEYVQNRNDSIELEYQLTIFPKNREEMLTSNYFIVPSQLPQYTILNSSAVAVSGVEFNEEKVYLRRDIIAVTSKVHWIDRNRKVKAGEVPVKKTQNKNKNLTELFLYEQTEPFSLEIDPQTGNFQSDGEYNSIYIPADFTPPSEMTIVKEKVGFVCSKSKIRHAKLVQGFTRAGGRVVPNQIGFLLYKGDEEDVLRLYAERQKKLEQSKGKNRLKELTALWNKLFKKIQLSEWSKTFQDK